MHRTFPLEWRRAGWRRASPAIKASQTATATAAARSPPVAGVTRRFPAVAPSTGARCLRAVDELSPRQTLDVCSSTTSLLFPREEKVHAYDKGQISRGSDSAAVNFAPLKFAYISDKKIPRYVT